MNDGEYRASFGRVWPLILPPLFMMGVGIWVFFEPSSRRATPAASAIGLCVVLGALALVLLGAWILMTERLVLTTDELGYRQVGARRWSAKWSEISAVRVASDASIDSVSYTLTLNCASGERRIRTTFLPIAGPDLAKELCRRSGAQLVSR